MKVKEGTGILVGMYQNKKCLINAIHTGYDKFEGKYFNNYLIKYVDNDEVIEKEVPINEVRVLYRKYSDNDILEEKE